MHKVYFSFFFHSWLFQLVIYFPEMCFKLSSNLQLSSEESWWKKRHFTLCFLSLSSVETWESRCWDFFLWISCKKVHMVSAICSFNLLNVPIQKIFFVLQSNFVGSSDVSINGNAIIETSRFYGSVDLLFFNRFPSFIFKFSRILHFTFQSRKILIHFSCCCCFQHILFMIRSLMLWNSYRDRKTASGFYSLRNMLRGNLIIRMRG